MYCMCTKSEDLNLIHCVNCVTQYLVINCGAAMVELTLREVLPNFKLE
ncbi:15346_t:CDS:2 [Funneliformis geosporum]|nr:15346_t:CDS:2 [Funneliformis geosporum]